MSFLAHLEELRWHLVRSVVALLLCAILIFSFQESFYRYVLLVYLDGNAMSYRWFCDFFALLGQESDFCNLSFNPVLQSLNFTDQLTNAIWVSLIFGFVVAFPYIVWEFWRFVAPGLSATEIKKSKLYIGFISLFFTLGVLFAYFIIIPVSIYFFYNYQITEAVNNQFTLNSYTSLVTNTLLWIGISFELPVIIYFIAKLGLVQAATLKKGRSYAFVIILILSAIITPPDFISQIAVSLPLWLLYEVGVYAAVRVEKNILKNDK